MRKPLICLALSLAAGSATAAEAGAPASPPCSFPCFVTPAAAPPAPAADAPLKDPVRHVRPTSHIVARDRTRRRARVHDTLIEQIDEYRLPLPKRMKSARIERPGAGEPEPRTRTAARDMRAEADEKPTVVVPAPAPVPAAPVVTPRPALANPFGGLSRLGLE